MLVFMSTSMIVQLMKEQEWFAYQDKSDRILFLLFGLFDAKKIFLIPQPQKPQQFAFFITHDWLSII